MCALIRGRPEHHGSAGSRNVSSAAFKDLELSVDAEPILHQHSLDWSFSVKDYPDFSLVRFLAGNARARQLPVILKELPDNPAHTEVHGKKTQGIANHLRDCSTWVLLSK